MFFRKIAINGIAKSITRFKLVNQFEGIYNVNRLNAHLPDALAREKQAVLAAAKPDPVVNQLNSHHKPGMR